MVLPRIQKDRPKPVLLYARETGLEPATSAVHYFHYFHNGVDYIFTFGFPLGTPVSSLYGALIPCVFTYKVPSVFAYP